MRGGRNTCETGPEDLEVSVLSTNNRRRSDPVHNFTGTNWLKVQPVRGKECCTQTLIESTVGAIDMTAEQKHVYFAERPSAGVY